MKDLANFGVQELSTQEQTALDGGIFNEVMDCAAFAADATMFIYATAELLAFN